MSVDSLSDWGIWEFGRRDLRPCQPRKPPDCTDISPLLRNSYFKFEISNLRLEIEVRVRHRDARDGAGEGAWARRTGGGCPGASWACWAGWPWSSWPWRGTGAPPRTGGPAGGRRGGRWRGARSCASETVR